MPDALMILMLAFVQNIAFSITSRSRNRDNKTYHILAAVFSNTIFFLTFRMLILAEMNLSLFIPYVAGTVAGSLLGVRWAMRIEALIGATADGHIKGAN